MKITKQNKEYLLKFLIQSNSLYDLLDILGNICKNLDLNCLNSGTKHFKYFQFTFFGLMVKAKVLLDMMVFRAEFLKKHFPEFEKIYPELVNIKKAMNNAYNLINNKRMDDSRIKIIELNKDYSKVFDEISRLKKLF